MKKNRDAMKIIKKVQSLILLTALLYQAHGMGMELWQKTQQKKFTQWVDEYLCTRKTLKKGLVRAWLELSKREKEDCTGLMLIGDYLEMITHQLLQKKLQEQETKREQMVQELISQKEQKRTFIIAQRKQDRLRRQQELRHQQKIKLPRNQRLPQAQRRMQVAHKKKR
jgi:hypothetical protein